MEIRERALRLRLLVLGLLLPALVLLSFLLGRYGVSPEALLRVLLYDLGLSEKASDEKIRIIVYNIRLPRIFLAVLVGGALGVSGAVYQGVFQNPMASPDVLGATSGAAFGASLAIYLGFPSGAVIGLAFLFSILAVVLAWLLSEKAKGRKVLNLVLGGMMVSSLLGAGTSYIKFISDPNRQLQEITFWLLGSLTGATKRQLLFAVAVMASGFVPLYGLRWCINLLTLGDEEARVLGMDVTKFRLLCIALSTLLIAASVSVSGMISWVGLLIPHFCRRIVGSNFKHLLPASLFLGGIFLLLVDNISRNVLMVEIPIGILTALIGAPFFMYLFIRKEESL